MHTAVLARAQHQAGRQKLLDVPKTRCLDRRCDPQAQAFISAAILDSLETGNPEVVDARGGVRTATRTEEQGHPSPVARSNTEDQIGGNLSRDVFLPALIYLLFLMLRPARQGRKVPHVLRR